MQMCVTLAGFRGLRLTNHAFYYKTHTHTDTIP